MAVPIVLGAMPGLEVKCSNAGCDGTARPEVLLPQEERAAVLAAPGAMARFSAYVRRPMVQTGLAAIDVAQAAPFILLMLSVAAAMWRLGNRGTDELARALPWLRRASFAALAAAIVPPLANSLRAMLLLPATPSGPSWYFAIDLGPFVMGLLLAFAAFIVGWALAAGSRASRDVAEFV
ncbi:hypothetical protein [Sphingomonas crusticola]|uniref:hypothetical protein n=1 Tax=Sphingomonas crusticola TaxID=1697973 RepID=UPI0013C36331|nr:hypothetical protein [Sphingomonas crusticola]